MRPASTLPFMGLLAVAGTAGPARAAEPPPVQAGLWEVQSLVTVDTGHTAAIKNTAATATATAPADAPRPRGYRVCITADRARSPMLPPRLPASAEVVFDAQSVSGSFTEKSATTEPRQVEFSYRRLSATSFEGSHDAQAGARVVRTQYFAQRVAADCGPLKPTAVAATGEP